MVQCGTIGAIAAGRVIEVTGTTFADETWTEIDRLIPPGRSRRLSVLTLRSARLAVPRKITERYP